MRLLLPPALLLAAACAPSGTPNCGIAHMAGATMVLDQFGTPNQTLSSVPPSLPERLVARLAAGPAYPAIVGRVDSLLAIGVEGALPPNVELGYGVLLLDPEGTARGVMLFEGDPIGGAPEPEQRFRGRAHRHRAEHPLPLIEQRRSRDDRGDPREHEQDRVDQPRQAGGVRRVTSARVRSRWRPGVAPR